MISAQSKFDDLQIFCKTKATFFAPQRYEAASIMALHLINQIQ